MIRSRAGRAFKTVRTNIHSKQSTLSSSTCTTLHRVRNLHTSPTSKNTLSTSSVNAEEIAHFSRLSSLWWDERGEFGLLHKMNPQRMQFIRDKILESAREDDGGEAWAVEAERSGNVLKGMDVLDVGCGGGILSEVCACPSMSDNFLSSLSVFLSREFSLVTRWCGTSFDAQGLARLGARTTAIDASESNIAIASIHASADPRLSSSSPSSSEGSLTYRHTSAETLVQEHKRFDVVCSMEVLEHVDNPAAFLETCAELVKPGGHLFFSTIARTPLSYLLTIFAAEKFLRLVEPGTHTLSKFINPSELVDFFRNLRTPGGQPWISRTYEHGLPTRTEAEVRGILYLPWKGEWVVTPRVATPWSTECNYLFWVRKPKDA
ncbi:hypothetical protein EW146_g3105 [Bondarzewia mesenterica]|uniref:Ubiquinone biosynthesis O-methyltransferase, mitochondrial n=1 Tax=Bondarzewia mesenterica TaxID=1095465 RepID=A0A4S4M4I4_9AGAM|nr:hypothetical protein EW146_g3105 [Bondarzewia mesenterica]